MHIAAEYTDEMYKIMFLLIRHMNLIQMILIVNKSNFNRKNQIKIDNDKNLLLYAFDL